MWLSVKVDAQSRVVPGRLCEVEVTQPALKEQVLVGVESSREEWQGRGGTQLWSSQFEVWGTWGEEPES